ncbi:DUF427 domain-containing protein [SAR202 cluster bacterium AD-802-E10_MRT_200m]|nr:DUF427 domain-containing protein [SAR202 cluster bacterium AD-802-E10_MRT_200m]
MKGGVMPSSTRKTTVTKIEHRAYMECTDKRIRVQFAGEMIADSKKVLIMHETGHVPVYYFPMDDVRMEFTQPTDHKTH